MFVQIPGFSDYLIDENGVVVSMKFGKWRILKQSVDRNGYLKVNFFVDRKNRNISVHRLVLLTWVGPSELEVNHKDGNKLNNHLSNLEYVTREQNIRHAWDIGLNENNRRVAIERAKKWQGEKHHNAKLSDVDAARLLSLKGTMTLKQAGQMFGVSRRHVSNIWSGKQRKHLKRE